MYTTYTMAGNTGKAPFFDETRGAMLEHGSNLYNPNLKWETTITRNIGFDYGFFNNRLSGSLDFYWNTTKDLLMKQRFRRIPVIATSIRTLVKLLIKVLN